MKRLKFTIDIAAQKSKIWEALWDDNSYRKWAGVFFEGSYAVSIDNWAVASKVHFLAPDKSGIYSRIEKHIPNQYIEFKHIGNVVDGKEQPSDDEVKKWSGATESYEIIEGKYTNTLRIDIDVMNEHFEFMTKTFPKALEVVKNNCK